MSQPSNELPEYLRRKLARTCTRVGCAAEAADDSDECAEHHEDSKRRKRESAARIRSDRRRRKQCIDCRKRCKTLRCSPCERRNRPRSNSVDKRPISVDKQPENWRPDPNRDGELSWMRYRGKGRRGRLTVAEQIDEDKRDAVFAIKEAQKFIEHLEELKDPDVLDLPVIQRQERKSQASAFASYAARILDELADKYGS